MTLHLVKLCVGASSLEDLARWQAENRSVWREAEGRRCVFHRTFQMPKRRDELLDHGALYWVIKGLVQARQRLVAIEEGRKEDGTRCCLLLLDPALIPVRPVPRRAFQGWRYLKPEDAPADLSGAEGDALADLPPAMRRELAALGLI
jgi:hypothetical protein